ncbi:MAG: hypothetical protein U0169_14465 [Polyangiaceae bacterium]
MNVRVSEDAFVENWMLPFRTSYDPIHDMANQSSGPIRPQGPGLAKTRGPKLFERRERTLLRGVDAAWRKLFETADSVSEGSARLERGRRVWYGSTSLILPLPPRDMADRTALVALAAGSVHVRIRAVRAATREATVRAPAALESCTCDVRIVDDPRGLRIDVEVQAPLIEVPVGLPVPKP